MQWTRYTNIIAENKTTVSDLGSEQIRAWCPCEHYRKNSVLTKIPLKIGNKHSRSQAMYNSARESCEVAFFMSCLRINRSIQQAPGNSPSWVNTISRRMLQKPSSFIMEMSSSRISQISGQQAFPSGALRFNAHRCRQTAQGHEERPETIPKSWRKKQQGTRWTVWLRNPGSPGPVFKHPSTLSPVLFNRYLSKS